MNAPSHQPPAASHRPPATGHQPPTTRHWRLSVLLAGWAMAAGWLPGAAVAQVDFARDVQPILVEHCYVCHGPDVQRAGLRFDQRATVLERPEDRAVLVPGEPHQSLLIERVSSGDPRWRMPPEGEPLGDAEVALLEQWVREGSAWPADARHWAFTAPRRPPLPQLPDASWTRNPIDYFILDRLNQLGLQPAPEADRRTLARRLHLDLIGLPPEPDEVERFVNDRSPQAYERLVDQLLGSPHYGERWAVPWLDLARYGDTDGYDFDHERPAWPYREWVIRALNDDLPFDQFTREQLAGDLLPDASPDAHVATGFLRNSGVPQYRFDVLVDRVSTVGTVFLGLTLECAQCHNHKYDPVSHEEFYRMFALFNNDEDRTITARAPLSGAAAETLIVVERESPEATHIAVGGSFLDRGAPVEPGALAALHPQPAGGVRDRRTLAEWLVDPDNPLLARVTVNRQWEAIFGQGLVRTSEDLGTRADRPTHPELLDWLAVEWVERGWSVKQLHRLLVTSAAYRQSAEGASRDAWQRDPTNEWLARGPRFRVDAEIVRDISLAAAGLLDRRLGGPSAFPPQPYGISENRERGALTWRTSEGADRYRRGLYTFWKRAALYPSLAMFDAPRREHTCPRRPRSNTPLQALVTLNDPAFVEAAVHLGRRMVQADVDDHRRQIVYGFQRCVSRPPVDEELAQLAEFYESELERFRQDRSAARALVSEYVADPDGWELDLAQWAACAMVANVLLNLDETITKP